MVMSLVFMSSMDTAGLPGWLDALAKSHGALGREYEASLRMLQEACS